VSLKGEYECKGVPAAGDPYTAEAAASQGGRLRSQGVLEMLGPTGRRSRVETAMGFKRARVELASSSATDAGSIARFSLTERTAQVRVLTAENPRENSQPFSKDLFVYGL
jgi:hypothetical protein